MKRLLVVIACLLGLACGYLLKSSRSSRGVYPFRTDSIYDFTGFYVGASLLGTPQMYDIDANLDMQSKVTGGLQSSAILYARPPLWAAIVKPFTLLSYRHALQIARLISIASLLIFIWLCPATQRVNAALAVCWLPPVWSAVSHGQDVPLILVLLALAVTWHRNRPTLAGVALALCFAKWHPLIFVPLLLIQHRRVLYGFLATAALLIVASFLIMPDWIRVYYSGMIAMPPSSFNGRPEFMPNLFSVFYPFGWSQAATISSVPVIGLLLFACRRLPFDLALPIFVLGSVLASWHANDCDMPLAIPAMLAAMKYSRSSYGWAIFALSPLAFLGYIAFNPLIFIAPCLCAIAFAIMELQPACINPREAMIWLEKSRFNG